MINYLFKDIPFLLTIYFTLERELGGGGHGGYQINLHLTYNYFSFQKKKKKKKNIVSNTFQPTF